MTKFARFISWIGHPLVFVAASVAVVVGTQLGLHAGFPILLALLLITLVPTAILILSGVRSGRWSDADVSVRKERQRFFPWAVPFSLVGVLVMYLIHAPAYIIRGGAITLALFLASWIVNCFLKLSLHGTLRFLLRNHPVSNRGRLGDDRVRSRYSGGLVTIIPAPPHSG